jgi:hypothetical protein
MSQNRSRASHSDVVSASEIGAWAFCPESWRLQSLGNPSQNTAALERGEAFHAKSATVETSSRLAIRVSWLLVLLGLALGLLALWIVR